MLKLVQTGIGEFDLALNTENTEQGNLETYVYSCVFSDAKDPKVTNLNCGGWWFKPFGNSIWLLMRNGLSPSVKEQTISELKRCLTAECVLKNVVVNDVGDGNVSGLTVNIEGLHNGEKSIVRAEL